MSDTKSKPRAAKSKAQQKRDQKAALIQSREATPIEGQIVALGQTPVEKRQRGRPEEYSTEIVDEFCAEIATGLSLRSVCRRDDMPDAKTIYRWFRTHPEFVQQYARAKEDSADALAEDILDIADDGSNDYMEIKDANGEYTGNYRVNGDAIQRSRLRVEARKWAASKLKPKKYGERLDLTTGGEALPGPNVYLPKELPYTVVKPISEGADAEQPAQANSTKI